MKNIVSIEQVREVLGTADVIVVDCRFHLADPQAGKPAYLKGHIPGAFYMDLDEDLSSQVTVHGGRHPLPDPYALAAKLGRLGVTRDTQVIVYDDQAGAMASRLWWLLRYYGHDLVQVMDGGYAAWTQAGYPVTTELPAELEASEPYPVQLREEMAANVEDVRTWLAADPSERAVLVDSREERRYLGLEEPIDKVAGHIPGAVNRFWRDSLDAAAKWKNAAEQQSRFDGLQQNSSQGFIVYCGSGITACPNILALEEAGYNNVRLYAGSWSDWISYEGNPVATGED